MKVTYIEVVEEQEVPVLNEQGEQIVVEGVPQTEITVAGTGAGEVTGFNRGPIAGESYIDADPSTDMVSGYGYDKWNMYQVFDGKLMLKPGEEIEAIEADTALKDARIAAEKNIRETYAIDSEDSVEVTTPEGTFTFNGGQDSASYITGAIQLAQALNEPTVVITDIDNVARDLSFESAETVSVAIAKVFRDAFAKQSALVGINSSQFTG